MLPKNNRIKKKKDFDKIFNKGRFFREDFLVLRFLSNNLKNSRFGFIVSQKVSKKAVLRNRIKRRLRELVKMKLRKMAKGMDFLIIACPGLETKDFWEMEEIINKLFKKAKIV